MTLAADARAAETETLGASAFSRGTGNLDKSFARGNI